MDRKNSWVVRMVGLVLLMSLICAGTSSPPISAAGIPHTYITGRIIASDGGDVGLVLGTTFGLAGTYFARIDSTGAYTFFVPNLSQYQLTFSPASPGSSYLLPYTIEAVYPGRTVDVTMSVTGILSGSMLDAPTKLPTLVTHIDLVREGSESITVPITIRNGILNPEQMLIPPGVYHPTQSWVYTNSPTQTIEIVPRKTTTVTLLSNNPADKLGGVHTIPGMPRVLGITLSGEKSLLISQNAGATWQRTLFASGYNGPVALTRRGIDDISFRVLMLQSTDAAGSKSLLRTGDSGQGWAEASTTPAPCIDMPLQLGSLSEEVSLFVSGSVSAQDPRHLHVESLCRRVYGGSVPAIDIFRHLYISDDYGISWQRRTLLAGLWAPSLTQVARYFQLGARTSYTAPHTLSESTDGGQTWLTLTTTLPPQFSPIRIVADGGLTSTLYLHGENLDEADTQARNFFWASDDEGGTWQKRPTPQACVVAPVEPQPILAAIPGKAGYLLLDCNANQFYRSRDGGLSWTNLNQVGRALFVDYANPGRIYLEKYKDLWASDDEGETWRLVWSSPSSKTKQFVPLVFKL